MWEKVWVYKKILKRERIEMKKNAVWPLLAALLLCLSGCSMAGDKTTDISIIYGAAAILSLLVLVGYLCSIRKKDGLFVLLFSSVLVVNIGYYALSVSDTLTQALWANRVAYLGSVFLPACMLLIILNAANICYPRRLPVLLAGIGAAVFLIAASPGVLTVYYKEVSLVTVNGIAMLQKVYGPLHFLYGIYLLAYFAAMVAVITYAAVKKKTHSTGHVVILAIAVFVNLGVWFIEQLVKLDFEVLSVSYIISELFLLGLHLMVTEQQMLHGLVQEANVRAAELKATMEASNSDSVSRRAQYPSNVKGLTPTEKAIFDAYLEHMTTKEIMALLNIKENTLKYHNRNLYQKLGVSSRKELQEIYSQPDTGRTPKVVQDTV